MSRKIPRNELDDIYQALASFEEGTSLEGLNFCLKNKLPSHTLRRRLHYLIEQGQVNKEGKARSVRYFITSMRQVRAAIPLSQEGIAIRKKISRPIQLRRPVGYNREFLDDYLPNETFYLSEAIRHRLKELGRFPFEQKTAGTYAKNIFERLLVDLAWNSSRLEGNTYSLLETEQLIKSNNQPTGKNLTETRMILNHKDAIEFLVESAECIDINRSTILNLHALLSNDLLGDPAACGRLRSIPVGVAKSTYLPLAVPSLIEECFDLVLQKARIISDPFEQAFFLLIHLPYLQPFDDVNKRVSRLSANISFIRQNCCPLSFIDVPEELYISGLLGVYELNHIELLRDVFVWAYERSCAAYAVTRRMLGEPDPFRIEYRDLIRSTIAQIVREKLNREKALQFIQKQADSVTFPSQRHFIEVIERELMGLHEGNIARYKLTPLDYENWQKDW